MHSVRFICEPAHAYREPPLALLLLDLASELLIICVRDHNCQRDRSAVRIKGRAFHDRVFYSTTRHIALAAREQAEGTPFRIGIAGCRRVGDSAVVKMHCTVAFNMQSGTVRLPSRGCYRGPDEGACRQIDPAEGAYTKCSTVG
eukprot:943865-Prymnesium_polylepis.1